MCTWVAFTFWLLWIMMLLWTWVYNHLFEIQLSVEYIPRSQIVGAYDNCTINFLRSCNIVFHSGSPILHCHSTVQRFQFLHILIIFAVFLNNSYLSRQEMVSHCGFVLHFLLNNWSIWDRERNINLLLFMHSLVDSCMCSDWGLNLQPWPIDMVL